VITVGRRSLFQSKPNPNLAKSSKIQPSPAKENPRKKLGFPWILLFESSLFKVLRRPPGVFFFRPFAPIPGVWSTARRGRGERPPAMIALLHAAGAYVIQDGQHSSNSGNQKDNVVKNRRPLAVGKANSSTRQSDAGADLATRGAGQTRGRRVRYRRSNDNEA
jgi:hypothetical protein